jgi:thiol peroxidase
MSISVKFHGNAMELQGKEIKVGDIAPDFAAVATDMRQVKLSDFKGEIVIISAVPSLDTPVCELQTKRFNEEAAKLKAKVLTISMDLPFAQRRFCDSFRIGNITTVSDYRIRDFSQKYGLYIKDLGLIARAVIVVGRDGKIAYLEVVPEVVEHPDYDKALEAAKNLGA